MNSSQLALIALYVVLATGLAAVVAGRAAWAADGAAVGRRTRGALAAILVLLGAFVSMVVPTGAWEPNNHGHERLIGAWRTGWLDPTGGEQQHGQAWFAAWRVVQHATFGGSDVYGFDILVTTLGVVAAFVATRGLASRTPRGPWQPDDHADTVALWTAAALASSPLWLKLAPMPTVLMLGACAWWVVVALAEHHARHGDGASRWAGWMAVVFTAQVHLEFLLLAPVAWVAVVASRAPERLRAAMGLQGAVAAGGAMLLLAAHFPTWTEVDVLGQLRPPSNPDPSHQPVWLAQRLAAVAAFLAAATAMNTDLLGGREPPSAARRVLLVATWGIGVLASLRPAATLLAHDNLWRVEAPNALTALVDPTWLPPVLLAAIAVGLPLGVAQAPTLTALTLTHSALFLLVYVDRFDAFSTWLRGSAPLWAALVPLAGLGLAGWTQAVPRGGQAVVGATLLAMVGLWAPAIVRPTDVQQEQWLLDAARDAKANGATVHGLTTADTSDVPAPERFAWRYFRGVVDDTLAASPDDLAPSLTALLRLPAEATCGRAVLLDLGCVRPVWSEQPGEVGRPPLVALGGQAWRASSQTALPKAWTTDPRQPGRMHRILPCWGATPAGVCVEPAANAEGGCLTWACGPAIGPTEATWIDPLCAAVRDRFDLIPIVETPVSAWTGNWYRMDPLIGAPPIGLYRVRCHDDASKPSLR
ncbi:MAG: hypothetical protein RLZZ383_2896 [Pseudomonadota bacterium]